MDSDRAETPEEGLKKARRQLLDRDYAVTLREEGASPIAQLAVVFDGKLVWVEAVET